MADQPGEDEERPSWKPVMARAEAERWAVGSAFPSPVYHVTTVEAAALIRIHGFDLGRRVGGRAWGNGVYAAIDEETRNRYLQLLGGRAVTVELRVRVLRLISTRILPLSRLSPQRQLLASIPAGVGRFIELRVGGIDPEAAMTQVIVEAGYDAIVIREHGFTLPVGGNQILVFEPNKVVVVDDERY